MSVAQHIRDRAGRFRWMGLLVVWAVFIVMAAVLLVERAGVQYSAGQHKLGMLAANDAVPASSAIFGQKPTCLVITDSDQAGVEDVKEQFDQILLDIKIAHRDVDLALDGADAICAAQRARLGLRAAVEYPFGPCAQAYRHRRSAH